MSTESGQAVHDLSRRAGRMFAAFAFNLLLLLGGALPLGIAVMGVVAMLAATPVGSGEGMLWIAIVALVSSVTPAPVIVGVMMAVASLIPRVRRRAALAGIAAAVVLVIAVIARRDPAAIPFWAGVVVGMSAYVALACLSTERLPRWPAWIAAALPAPVLIVALAVAAA